MKKLFYFINAKLLFMLMLITVLLAACSEQDSKSNGDNGLNVSSYYPLDKGKPATAAPEKPVIENMQGKNKRAEFSFNTAPAGSAAVSVYQAGYSTDNANYTWLETAVPFNYDTANTVVSSLENGKLYYIKLRAKNSFLENFVESEPVTVTPEYTPVDLNDLNQYLGTAAGCSSEDNNTSSVPVASLQSIQPIGKSGQIILQFTQLAGMGANSEVQPEYTLYINNKDDFATAKELGKHTQVLDGTGMAFLEFTIKKAKLETDIEGPNKKIFEYPELTDGVEYFI